MRELLDSLPTAKPFGRVALSRSRFLLMIWQAQSRCGGRRRTGNVPRQQQILLTRVVAH